METRVGLDSKKLNHFIIPEKNVYHIFSFRYCWANLTTRLKNWKCHNKNEETELLELGVKMDNPWVHLQPFLVQNIVLFFQNKIPF